MRKISEVTPGPLGIECVLVEKRIELSDKRRDFAWLRACYASARPVRTRCRLLWTIFGQRARENEIVGPKRGRT